MQIIKDDFNAFYYKFLPFRKIISLAPEARMPYASVCRFCGWYAFVVGVDIEMDILD